jgi:hypothetical protein
MNLVKFPLVALACVLFVSKEAAAVTEAWHVTLKTSGEFDGSPQVVADGSGGCACRYVVNGTNGVETTTFLWLNAKGEQVYKKTYDGGRYLTFIVSLNKSSLVYTVNSDGWTDDSSYVVANTTGTEVSLADCRVSDPNGAGGDHQHSVLSDKKGFFAIRYSDITGTVELVRFLYK